MSGAKSKKKYIAVCDECGGQDMVFDTTAMWSVEQQKFVAADEVGQEDAYCQTCESEPSHHWSWMAEYTVWAIEKTGRGTIWISKVLVPESADDAAIEAAALSECAGDWGMSPEDIHILGAAHGDISLAFWNDLSE